MTEEWVLGMGSEALRTAMYLAAPLLLSAMIIGIIVSVLQAITQINEATLTFIPKMVAVVVVLAVMAPWMLKTIQEYAVQVITSSAEIRE